MNITDPIFFQSSYQPEALAICAPGIDLVTFGKLEKTINNIMRRALSFGVQPGQVVALVIKQPVIHAAMILAMARLGVTTASPSSTTLPTGLMFDAIIADCDHPFHAFKTIAADPSWIIGDGAPIPMERAPGGTDLCRILLTSGTTGDTKGVALTHDMILGRLLRYYSAYGPNLPKASRFFCDMAFGSPLGFQFLVYALGKGGAFFVRGNNAENTLRAIAFYRVDAIVASPFALAEFAKDYETYRCRHTFDVIVSAGSLTSKRLADQIRSRMGSNLICDYGSTEASVTTTAPVHLLESVDGAVGWIAPGIEIEIVDETGRVLPAGQEGIVRVRGDHVANAYASDPKATAKFFRDGWFFPGDLGRLTTDGMLVIVGRQNVILNSGGEKINPESIEAVLNTFGGIVDAAAFGVRNDLGIEEIWAAFVSGEPIEDSLLRQHCAQLLAPAAVPKRFIRVDKLPHNEAGKLDRLLVPQLVNPPSKFVEARHQQA
jgi:acyl-coenzyme A synthetase/AMP-(fatty) acid ligase